LAQVQHQTQIRGPTDRQEMETKEVAHQRLGTQRMAAEGAEIITLRHHLVLSEVVEVVVLGLVVEQQEQQVKDIRVEMVLLLVLLMEQVVAAEQVELGLVAAAAPVAEEELVHRIL